MLGGERVEHPSAIEARFRRRGAARGARLEKDVAAKRYRVDGGHRGELTGVIDELFDAVGQAFFPSDDGNPGPRFDEIVATRADRAPGKLQVSVRELDGAQFVRRL